MAKNYYFIDDSVSAGSSTMAAIQNESAGFGIGATSDISAGIITATSLQVGTGITANNGVITAVNGFISVGNTTPIKIALSGNILSFTAVGIGSTFFTLA
jgi:hypothetical protein